jgi:hypothetical protein
MNIRGFGSSTLPPVYWLRGRSFGEDSSPDATTTQPSSNCAAGGVCAAPPSRLPTAPSPSGPVGSTGLSVQESHLALQIRSRTQLRTASDGTISERDTATLRFHYDLTTADGQHVELNVKAKVRQASIQDAAGNSASKSQVKLQFSLLEQGVADGLSPLQSDQAPSDTQSGVSNRLQAFLNSVGDALQHFIEGDKATGDTVTADDLIKKTVDTFNTLVDAITNLFFPTAGSAAPQALPASDDAAAQIPANAATVPDNSPVSPAEPAANNSPAAAVSPVPAEGGITNETANAEPATVASGDNSVANVPAIPAAEIPAAVIPAEPNAADPIPAELIASDPSPTDASPVDDVAPLVRSAPAEGSVAPPADSSAAASHAQLVTQVLQTVRFRFVQSLTQIIHTLTPAERSGDSSSASSQLLVYQNSLSLRIHTASVVDLNA